MPIRLLLLSLLLLPGLLLAKDFAELVKEGQPQLSRVEAEPDSGSMHVATGTAVAEGQPFPVSGTHWSEATPSGFFKDPRPKGELIHALQHGQVVIYYDEPGFKAQSMLTRLSAQFAAPFAGVIAVPSKGLGGAVVLTAWRYRLRLPAFDEAAVAAFIDAYMGRGPENRVR
jgi:hypothetical protein